MSSPLFVRILNKIARAVPSSTPLLIRVQKRVYRGLGTLDRYKAEWRNYNADIPTGRDTSGCVSISRTILTYTLLYPGILAKYWPLIRTTAGDVFLMNLMRTSILSTQRRRIGHLYYALKSVREKHTGSGFALFDKLSFWLAEPRREPFYYDDEQQAIRLQLKILMKAFYQASGIHGTPQKLLLSDAPTSFASSSSAPTHERVFAQMDRFRALQKPLPLDQVQTFRRLVLALVELGEKMEQAGLRKQFVYCSDQLRDWLYEHHPLMEYRFFHAKYWHVEMLLGKLALELASGRTDLSDSDKFDLIETATERVFQGRFPPEAADIAPPALGPKFVYSFVRSDLPRDESVLAPSVQSACLLAFVFSCPYSVLAGTVPQSVAAIKAPAVHLSKGVSDRLQQLSDRIGASAADASQAVAENSALLQQTAAAKLSELGSTQAATELKGKALEAAQSFLGKSPQEALKDLSSAEKKALAGTIIERLGEASRKWVLHFINGYKDGLYKSLTVSAMDVLKNGFGRSLLLADKAAAEGSRLAQKYNLKERAEGLAQSAQATLSNISLSSLHPDGVDERRLKEDATAALSAYLAYLDEVNELYRAARRELADEKSAVSAWQRYVGRLRRRTVPTNDEVVEENAILDYHGALQKEIARGYMLPGAQFDEEADFLVFKIVAQIITEGCFPSGSVPSTPLFLLLVSKSCRDRARTHEVPACLSVIKDAALGVVVGRDFLDKEPMLESPFNQLERKVKEIVTTTASSLRDSVNERASALGSQARDKANEMAGNASASLTNNATLQAKLGQMREKTLAAAEAVQQAAHELKREAAKQEEQKRDREK